MATNCPYMRAFRMTLEVLDNRNNRIWRMGNVRVFFFPPISENAMAAHVIDLLGVFCFSKCVGDISVT
jgi:hypothetical protein